MTVILIILCALDGTSQARFESGNQAYADERFDEAVTHYLGVIEQGVENEVLHFNLANSYLKQGDIGRAILHYHKAERFDPNDDDIRHNLNIAIQQRVDPPIDEDQDRFLQFINQMMHIMPYSFQFWIAFFLIIIASVAGIALIAANKKSKALAYLLVISGLIGGTLTALTFWQYHHLTRDDYAVVLADEVAMLSGPSRKETTIYSIHAGIRCQIMARSDGWIRIRLANGYNGWVPRDKIELI